jgi:threonine synthase
MEFAPTVRGLVDVTDHSAHTPSAAVVTPPGRLLEHTYDPDAFAWPSQDAPHSLWRYGPVLPIADSTDVGAGWSPLIAQPGLAADAAVDSLWIKDEGQNPTGSVHDRAMAMVVGAARIAGAELCALAAAGAAAESAAAYCGLHGRRMYAFVPSRAPFSAKAMVNVHGAQMRVIGGRLDAAVTALDEQLQSPYHPVGAGRTPFHHDGLRTIAYEIIEQLPAPPTAIVVPVGSGALLMGLIRGLELLVDVGELPELPTICAVQPSGCAPIATAVRAGRELEPWATPDTIVGELEDPDPILGAVATTALDRIGGTACLVGDDDALEASVTAAQEAVLPLSPAGGAALAAVSMLSNEGDLGPDDRVVVINPTAAAKTPDLLRCHLMGKVV